MVLASMVGCASFEARSYRLDERSDAAITKYYYAMESHRPISFSAFVAKIPIPHYYIYVGDRQLSPDLHLIAPKFSPGYSIQRIMQHGNRIYAIPIKTYHVELSPLFIFYWAIYERDGEVYAIGTQQMRFSHFRKEFTQH